MRAIKGIAAAGAVAGVILGVGILPAQAATDSVAVTVRLDNRSDSGEDGNYWATDDIRRQVLITEVSSGVYEVGVWDIGTFTTIVGEQTPGSGDTAVFDESIVGQVQGGFTATVVAAPDFATFDRTALAGAPVKGDSTGSGAMLTSLFTDGSLTGLFNEWGWDYRYQGQQWHNFDDGNSGNITG